MKKERLLEAKEEILQRRNEIFWASFYPIVTFLITIGSFLVIWFGGRDVLMPEFSRRYAEDTPESVAENVQYFVDHPMDAAEIR